MFVSPPATVTVLNRLEKSKVEPAIVTLWAAVSCPQRLHSKHLLGRPITRRLRALLNTSLTTHAADEALIPSASQTRRWFGFRGTLLIDTPAAGYEDNQGLTTSVNLSIYRRLIPPTGHIEPEGGCATRAGGPIGKPRTGQLQGPPRRAKEVVPSFSACGAASMACLNQSW
ncbi:hypothetical protein VTK26DRAFT_5106 [Humicola hyalothermophila]